MGKNEGGVCDKGKRGRENDRGTVGVRKCMIRGGNGRREVRRGWKGVRIRGKKRKKDRERER